MSFLSVRAQEIPVVVGNQPQQVISVTEVARQVRPGQIVVMGEHHGFKKAQQGQMELLQALRDQGLKVSVGLEFFYYPQQDLVNQFCEGKMPEAEFLQNIQWGNPSFDFYRDQALFPNRGEGARTLALNAPRSLTGKISKQGLDALTDEEKQQLPPQFELGRESYKKRFLAMMPHLPTPEAGDRYFAAQSVWDDTMAWQAASFIEKHPDQVLVIVVGDFHAQFGGGLPDRIATRTKQKPLVFSFVNRYGLSAEELAQELGPSSEYGPRGDYIWVAEEELTTSGAQP